MASTSTDLTIEIFQWQWKRWTIKVIADPIFISHCQQKYEAATSTLLFYSSPFKKEMEMSFNESIS
jgi:hypothetical protein